MSNLNEQNWPANNVERWAIERLVPYARNARTHTDQQVDQVAASMREWGWTNPVLCDEDGMIIAGHCRVMAAHKLGVRDVPVMVARGWTDAQKRAYVLADNQLAINAGWDEKLLKIELGDLNIMGFDLSLIGFGDELDDLLDEEGGDDGKDPEDAPPLAEDALTVVGDVWVLGPHKVCCCDSTQAVAWELLMGTEKADCVFTDPPYNVAIGKKNESFDKIGKGNKGKTGGIENDDMSPEEFQTLLNGAMTCLNGVMKAGAAIYVSYPDRESLAFHTAFAAAEFKLSGVIVWKKNRFVLGRTDYQNIHEPIIYGWKPGSKHRWYGGRKQVTVQEAGPGEPFKQLDDGRWAVEVGDTVMYLSGDVQIEQSPASVVHCDAPNKSGSHPTMKPVALVEKLLKSNARRGDLVVDAFGGSGSTLIAADRLGMSARLMELDPAYVDVIVKRWQDFTGRRAVHAETGKEYPIAPGEVA